MYAGGALSLPVMSIKIGRRLGTDSSEEFIIRFGHTNDNDQLLSSGRVASLKLRERSGKQNFPVSLDNVADPDDDDDDLCSSGSGELELPFTGNRHTTVSDSDTDDFTLDRGDGGESEREPGSSDGFVNYGLSLESRFEFPFTGIGPTTLSYELDFPFTGIPQTTS